MTNLYKGSSFRNTASFGKRIEHWIIGLMLKEGMDVYIPLVDDNAVDAIVQRLNGTTALIQIKARSKGVKDGHAGLFAAIPHPKRRKDYWFVFYSERMEKTWLMSSAEFLKLSVKNKNGKNKGLHSIWFNGNRKNKLSSKREEYVKPQFEKFLINNFSRIK